MTTILTKKKDTTGAPAPGDLTNSAGGAELAVNTFDKRLYTKDAGGNVVEIGTNPSTIDTTTVDTTNLEVTNIKAKDGTAAATIANSTGKITVSTELAVDNLNLSGNTISSTDTNGAINLAPNGTGQVVFNAGAVGTPAITTTGDTNTGIYFPAADTIAFTEGGTEAMRIDSSGNFLVGGTTQSGTANRLAVFSGNKFGLSIIDTTAQAAGVGGALNLGGNYRSSGDAQAFTRIAAAKENATDTNFAYAMAFSTTPNGGTFTEAMRIDSSGNVGIGTSSPDGKLTIQRSGATKGVTTGVAFKGQDGSTWGGIGTDGAVDNFVQVFSALGIKFSTGNIAGTGPTTNIDSSGNLGLGVTPSAWASNTALQVKSAAFWGLASTPTFATMSANTYYNGSTYKYISSAQATDYYQFLGTHVWRNAVSGTADADIAFTSAMTLNASGNLGIGTSSPACRLDLNRGSAGLLANFTDGVNTNFQIETASLLATIGPSAGSTGMAFKTGNTERMRILSTGNILSLLGGSTTATGTGIAFPATQSASSDANTLDDYEEGTWTPTDTSGAGLTFDATTSATYTKIGNRVFLSAEVGYPSTASGASASIGGLPFAGSGSGTPSSGTAMNNANLVVNSFITNSGSSITLYGIGSSFALLANSNFSGKFLYISITYYVD